MNHTRMVMISILMCSSTLVQADAANGQESDELAQVNTFSFLVGDWDCTGKVLAHGQVLAHSTTAQVHGSKVVDGHWILFRYDENKTTENPRPFHIDQYFGYDPAIKHFVSVALDTGGYFSETSAGWISDSITFDEMTDGKIIGHDTFTRRSQDEISHTGRSMDKDERWIETDEEICRRTR